MVNVDDTDYFQVIHTGNGLVWPGVESGVFGLVSASTSFYSHATPAPFPPAPPGSGSTEAAFGSMTSHRVKETLRIHASSKRSKTSTEDSQAGSRSLAGAVMASHRTVVVGDAKADSRYFPSIDGHCADGTALILVSTTVKGRVHSFDFIVASACVIRTGNQCIASNLKVGLHAPTATAACRTYCNKNDVLEHKQLHY
jgi:hypothetical protein